MGSMHTGLEEAKNGFEKMAAFYRERAQGGVGLIVTGGIAPDLFGKVQPLAAKLTNTKELAQHKIVTEAVHDAGGKICLQILHAGRYAYSPLAIAPSRIKSPISPFRPLPLPHFGVKLTIKNYVRCARLAQQAGYDGVEVMGSEGYLINQFIAERTNKRSDSWGGNYLNRIRLPVDIVRQIRAKVGAEFIIMYRLSMLDLVDEGSNWREIVTLAKAVADAGATIINTGIGWHEARIPTIASLVPRAAFSFVTKKLKGEVNLPLVTTNRINTPEVAEKLLAEGCADMISMARPFLADPDFVNKAITGREDEINTCIACNQACLDQVFQGRRATCLVNPRACYETELVLSPLSESKKLAIVGAGPAGLSAAVTAAARGHQVDLYEARGEIGGQLNLAMKIPGKEEFKETIRYFNTQIRLQNVRLVLNHKVTAAELIAQHYDEIILASGVTPRRPNIKGIHHAKVLTYQDLLEHEIKLGKRVAIVGAGGIGFDVAVYLMTDMKQYFKFGLSSFLDVWGIDQSLNARGGINRSATQALQPCREVYLLQRKATKHGASLGKTTGWIHRALLKKSQVTMIGGVSYTKIDNRGLHIQRADKPQVLDVDQIVICSGQRSSRELQQELQDANCTVHIIGGAEAAGGIDAQRAIRRGFKVAAKI